MAFNDLSFEKPINELKENINKLREDKKSKTAAGEAKISRLEKKLQLLIETTYAKLSPWDIIQIARHPKRPYMMDYIKNIGVDFIELHGDRLFSDDTAIVGGFLTIGTQKVMIIGQEKGRGTDEKLYRNFGMAHPEGYRKALRLMRLAEKFSLPVITFIDTPGAYPGIGAEERGQAVAIAKNLMEMSRLKTPLISVVIGEGGSGGALGIGVTDKIFMLQYATYSVISPEGCASILFRDAKKAEISSKALKLTSKDLKKYKIIDKIIPEPQGGAHNNPEEMYDILKNFLIDELSDIKKKRIENLVKKRMNKYRNIGVYSE
jgi:acetyl-CoA carboxylase carboxyl transferase subunit alpha